MGPLLKRASAAIFALVLVFGQSLVSNADAWIATGEGSPDGTMIAALTEGSDYSSTSVRMSHVQNSDGSFDEFLCPDGATATGGCSTTTPGAHLDSNAILPVCKIDTQLDCIEFLEFGTAKGALAKATLIKEMDGPTYPASTANGGQPAAGTVSIWDAPGLKNAAGTTKYAVQVSERSEIYEAAQGFETSSLSAAIIPVSDRYGSRYQTAKLTEVKSPDGRTRVGGWAYNDQHCAVTESGYCAVTEDFSPDSRFSISIRASKQITGWFKGRIQNPNVSIQKFSDHNNRIILTAEPVTVPRLAALVTPENTTEKGKILLSRSMRTGAAELFKGNTLRNNHPDSSDALDWVSEFRLAAKDTAAGISTLWNFSTLNTRQLPMTGCFDDKSRVVGVVTTNATALAVGTPDFSNGQLEYKVAGLHYSPDGKSLNEGTYDLVIRSDVARCLYHFTSAPISASISVVGEGGENKVATTLVKEQDGWIKMSAYGYTFSSPTIKVKLTQTAKKSTITCVRGKLTKKVTAVNARCPAGYKAK